MSPIIDNCTPFASAAPENQLTNIEKYGTFLYKYINIGKDWGKMKLFRKNTALFLVIELIAASFTVSLAENETVSIASEAELIAFAASVNAGNTVNAVLTDDIVLSDAAITIAPAERTSFKGEFDGNGHTITFTNAINTVYSGSTFSAYSGDFDEMKIMALDSLSGMKPLCEAYMVE